MKEFVEKLIGRLEEKENEAVLKAPNTSDISNTEYQKWMMKSYGFKESIEIVNQLAEEYGKDTNVTTNNGWIPCSDRLPEESFCDDGWVKPSDAVLVFTRCGSFGISRYWGNRRNQRDYYEWVDIECRQNEVLAWMSLPEPYQKGE